MGARMSRRGSVNISVLLFLIAANKQSRGSLTARVKKEGK